MTPKLMPDDGYLCVIASRRKGSSAGAVSSLLLLVPSERLELTDETLAPVQEGQSREIFRIVLLGVDGRDTRLNLGPERSRTPPCMRPVDPRRLYRRLFGDCRSHLETASLLCLDEFPRRLKRRSRVRQSSIVRRRVANRQSCGWSR